MSIKFWRYAYALVCVGLAVWLGGQFVQGAPIQTQLTALLPQETASNPIFQAADKAQEAQLNQSIVLLVGAQEPEKAFQAASEVAERWQASGLFDRVDGKIEPNLDELRQSLARLGSATLPIEQVRQLHEQPEQYFAERAEAVLNPFSAQLLSLEDDWLGFSRFALRQIDGKLQWHAEHAMLYTEYGGQTWVWIRAHLPDTAPNPALLTLLQQSKATAQTQHYQLLAMGGVLFASDAKLSAERESSWMSAVGLTLTFALLLLVFRSGRIWALLLPLGAGLLCGCVATVAILGEIHALTLVVGTSLVGVLVDFPLHWLASSLFQQTGQYWDGQRTMRRVLPAFLVSLTITAVGYVLLWFTPLPVLRQTAVFSVVSLLGAFLATVLWLPPLFQDYQAKTTPFARWMMRLTAWVQGVKWRYMLLILAGMAVFGVMKSQWQDDIRNWMTLRPDLLEDSRQIAEISGMSAGQTILLTAHSPDELLQKNRLLEQVIQQNQLAQVQSLNQWILPISEQVALKKQFASLAQQPHVYAPLVALGVPESVIQAALRDVANAPSLSLADSLRAPQAEAFRGLYLGEVGGQYASLVRLYDVRDVDSLAKALSSDWVILDKRAHLNAQFAQTRNQAGWLKLGSFVVAWLVLWRLFGWRKGSLILAVPTVAVLGTLGVLAYGQIPISLFAMFGLLLAAAIGVDYAVYALTAPETASARVAGITLAALTTGISFILLAGSATPAVAAFGISVSCGVVLNWLLAVGLVGRSHN